MGDDTVGEILADKEYFYKKLLANANCRLQNIPIFDENTGKEKNLFYLGYMFKKKKIISRFILKLDRKILI